MYGPYTVYVKSFQHVGYDDTTFLTGMKEQDLVDIGIENRGHPKKIYAETESLPPGEIDPNVLVSKIIFTSQLTSVKSQQYVFKVNNRNTRRRFEICN